MSLPSTGSGSYRHARSDTPTCSHGGGRRTSQAYLHQGTCFLRLLWCLLSSFAPRRIAALWPAWFANPVSDDPDRSPILGLAEALIFRHFGSSLFGSFWPIVDVIHEPFWLKIDLAVQGLRTSTAVPFWD